MGIGLKDIIKDDKDALVRDKQKRTIRMLIIVFIALAILIAIVIGMLISNGAKDAKLDRIKKISVDMGNLSKIAKNMGDSYVANNYTGSLVGIPLDNQPQSITVNGKHVEYRYGYYMVSKDQLKELTTTLNCYDDNYLVNYTTGDIVNVTGVKTLDGKTFYCLEDITAIASSNEVPDIHYISSANEMLLIARNPAGIYRLSNNIDMANLSTGEGWTPVANFTGTLDGRGYTIKNLTVNRVTTEKCGLFANVLSGADIKNIKFEQVNVTGGEYTGTLAGTCSGNITNITIDGGQVNSNRNYVGSLVGSFDQGEIRECTVDHVTLTGNTSVGGLIGTMYNGLVEKSYANAKIIATDTVGGLIGSVIVQLNSTNATLSQDFANTDITGQKNVGGLVGTIQAINNVTFKLEDCYSLGSIDNGGENKGGLIGYLNTANSPTLYIQSSYSATAIPTEATARGGFIGRSNIQTGTNTIIAPKSYFEVERSMDFSLTDVGVKSGVPIDFTAMSPEEMKIMANFSGWNVERWGIDEHITRPYLRWE